MNRPPAPNPYTRHRFPVEIISHCAWLYFRFCLSHRGVEELMAERGVTLTYEAVRYWCRKFGQVDVNQPRRRRPRPGDKWHLDEVLPTIHGERHYLFGDRVARGHLDRLGLARPTLLLQEVHRIIEQTLPRPALRGPTL